jgi:HEAT repeat protein
MSRFLGVRYPPNYPPTGMSLQELINWLENLPEGEKSHRQNIVSFNAVIHEIIACDIDAVEPLIDHLLSTHNRWMQWGAIWALADIEDRRAIEPLWEVFHKTHDDLGMQYNVLNALSLFKDERIFSTLASLLRNKHRVLRQIAIRGLGNLGDDRAVELLFPFLTYPDEKIKFSRITLSGSEGSEAIPETDFNEKRSIIQALGKIESDQSVRVLEAIINAEDIRSLDSSRYDRLRCDAVNALGQMDFPSATVALQAALNHSKRGVRRHARKVLKGSKV